MTLLDFEKFRHHSNMTNRFVNSLWKWTTWDKNAEMDHTVRSDNFSLNNSTTEPPCKGHCIKCLLILGITKVQTVDLPSLRDWQVTNREPDHFVGL